MLKDAYNAKNESILKTGPARSGQEKVEILLVNDSVTGVGVVFCEMLQSN